MIIFVAGVYGVGKTTLCGHLSRELGYVAASASTLIRERRGKVSWSESKETNDIQDNQVLLINAVSELKTRYKNVILDGHFALLNGEGRVEKIDVDVFAQLNIYKIVLLESDAEAIAAQLESRDKTKWTPSTIRNFMAAERENAMKFHRVSSVPLRIFQNRDYQKIISYILEF